MPIYIKTGCWEKRKTGYNYALDLDQAIADSSAVKQSSSYSTLALYPVGNTYPNTVAMVNDQVDQTINFYQYVTDVNEYYLYLGTSGSSLNDYKKLTPQEQALLVHYNEGRKPVHQIYADDTAMFADQKFQHYGWLYRIETDDSHWEYLGTTLGNINDYKPVGGGGGISGIGIEEEGTSIVTEATAINFIGGAVTATDATGGKVDVTISTIASSLQAVTDVGNTTTNVIYSTNTIYSTNVAQTIGVSMEPNGSILFYNSGGNYTLKQNSGITQDITIEMPVRAAGTYTMALTDDVPTIDDTAYGISWDGNLDGATKNAIYDKIETLGGGSGTGLEAIDEGNGTGWRLVGRDGANYGNIGQNAVDFSVSITPSSTKGALTIGDAAFGLSPTYTNINLTNSGNNIFYGSAGTLNMNTTGSFRFNLVGGSSHTISLRAATGSNSNIISGTANTINFDAATNNIISGSNNTFGTATLGVRSALLTGNSNTLTTNASFSQGQFVTGEGNFSRVTHEVSLGRWGTDYTPSDNDTDRLLNIGKGANSGARSDAFTILKNGETGIGIDSFKSNTTGERVQVNGTVKATSLKLTGLSVYTDDAAAGVGGLVQGDVYQTSGGELRIKL